MVVNTSRSALVGPWMVVWDEDRKRLWAALVENIIAGNGDDVWVRLKIGKGKKRR